MGPLSLSSVRVIGEDAADFTLNTAGMLNAVPPARTTTFSVAYAPLGLALRSRQAWLVVSSDDLDEGTTMVALSG